MLTIYASATKFLFTILPFPSEQDKGILLKNTVSDVSKHSSGLSLSLGWSQGVGLAFQDAH